LIRIVCRLVSIAAAIVVFLEGGRHLGIPLTTLLASAGVGGLAVALAAQDTLKSLFGSIMILLDKPYRAGERVIVGDYDGIVEEIGLRSTKVRLLTGHQASIPNEEMAKSRIENVGRRPHIRRTANIHIPLDTPREKVEKAIEVVRSALDNHEGMQPDFVPRVYFNEFNPDSFNIRVIYWYHPPNYWDFLAFSEKLNLTIMRAFEDQGIQFSLPARITYTSPTSEPSPLEIRAVAETQRKTSK
jgi:MscS family membrane protein